MKRFPFRRLSDENGKPPIVGMARTFENSYRNAILQCLLADEALVEKIRGGLQKISGKDEMEEKMPLTKWFLIMANYRHRSTLMSPEMIVAPLSRKYPQFKEKEQYYRSLRHEEQLDPFDFLKAFLEMLQEEHALSGAWSLGGYGLSTKTEFLCMECGEVRTEISSTFLGHELPLMAQTMMFNDSYLAPGCCIYNFLSETLKAVALPIKTHTVLDSCPGNWSMVDTKLAFAPRILLVRIDRSSGPGRKNEMAVKIPQELEVGKLLAKGVESDSCYQLFAVVRHRSSDNSPFGEFVGDILKDDGTWTCCEDDKVYLLKSTELQQTEGYLCFYRLTQKSSQ